MKAEQARQLGNRLKVNQLIETAVLQGKDNIDISKRLVNHQDLTRDGYKVSGAHQMSETVNVSWRKIEDRRGG